MSASNVLNLNEQIAVVTLAAATSVRTRLPYIPEFVEITNSGTGTCYAAGVSSTGSMTVPASTFPTLPTTQPGSEIQPGASKTYRFPLPGAAGFQDIAAISPLGTTISIKIGRGV